VVRLEALVLSESLGGRGREALRACRESRVLGRQVLLARLASGDLKAFPAPLGNAALRGSRGRQAKLGTGAKPAPGGSVARLDLLVCVGRQGISQDHRARVAWKVPPGRGAPRGISRAREGRREGEVLLASQGRPGTVVRQDRGGRLGHEGPLESPGQSVPPETSLVLEDTGGRQALLGVPLRVLRPGRSTRSDL